MFDTKSPMIFWCYCIEMRASVINYIIRVNHLLAGKPPHSRFTGQSTYISSIYEFRWYDWVIYRVEGHKPPFTTNNLEGNLSHKKFRISHIIIGTNGYW